MKEVIAEEEAGRDKLEGAGHLFLILLYKIAI